MGTPKKKTTKGTSKKKPIKKVVIDRSKWIVYGAKQTTSMYDPPSGKMCCMGFIARQAFDMTLDEIRYESYPSMCVNIQKKDPEHILCTKNVYNTDFAVMLADVNDLAGLSLREREQRIRKLCADKGIKCTFKGKYPQYVIDEDIRHRATWTDSQDPT